MIRLVLVSLCFQSLFSFSQCISQNPVFAGADEFILVGHTNHNDFFVDHRLIREDFFENNYCIVRESDDRMGLIDRKGKLIVPLIYDSIRHFSTNVVFAGMFDSEANHMSWKKIKLNTDVTDYELYYDLKYLSEGFIAVLPWGETWWNFMDVDGELILGEGYRRLTPFKNGYASVLNLLGYWGVVDSTGREVLACKYTEPVVFSEGLAFIASDPDDNYIDAYEFALEEGIIEDSDSYYGDKKLKKFYEFNYAFCYVDLKLKKQKQFGELGMARPFRNGLAFVYKGEGNQQGFVNKAGEMVIDFSHIDIPLINLRENGFSKGQVLFLKKTLYKPIGQAVLINMQGEVVFHLKEVKQLEPFGNEHYLVTRESSRGAWFQIIDMTGGVIIDNISSKPKLEQGWIKLNGRFYDFNNNEITQETIYDPMFYTNDFVNDVVQLTDMSQEHLNIFSSAFMNPEKKIVSNWYADASYYNGDYFWAQDSISRKFAQYDMSGKMLSKSYDQISLGPRPLDECHWDLSRVLDYYSDSVMAVKSGNVWGYLHWDMTEVVTPQFDSVSNFYRGFAFAFLNKQWFAINKQGKKVSETFDELLDSELAICRIKNDGLYQYVNYKGELISENKYEYASAFYKADYGYVLVDDIIKFVDVNGEIIVKNVSEEFKIASGKLLAAPFYSPYGGFMLPADSLFYIDSEGKRIGDFKKNYYDL